MASKKNIPEWFDKTNKEFVYDFQLSDYMFNIVLNGLYSVSEAPETRKAIDLINEVLNIKSETMYDIDKIKELSEVAKEEIDNDFQFYHSLFCVKLWSDLEHYVVRLLSRYIENTPQVMEIPKIRKLRIGLGEYFQLDGEEKYHYVLELLQRDLDSKYRLGEKRFESLFQIFRLEGITDVYIRKYLLELQQVRNVIVHKRGIIDSKLIERCPWLKFKVGEKLVISRKRYFNYRKAALNYVARIIIRTYERVFEPAEKALGQEDIQ